MNRRRGGTGPVPSTACVGAYGLPERTAAETCGLDPHLPGAVASRLASMLAGDPSLAAAVSLRLPSARLETASDLLADRIAARLAMDTHG